MKQVLTERDEIKFLDSKAAEFLAEARQWFTAAGLNEDGWLMATIFFCWDGTEMRFTTRSLCC